MAGKLPHMPLYVFDLESDRDCRTMSDADFGRFMRLLIRQWVEGDVPGDVDSAIRDAMLDSESSESVQSLLDRKFPRIDGGRRANQRLKQIRDHALARVEANRENGKLGGRPLKTERLTDGKPEGSVSAKQRVSGSGSGSESGKGKGGNNKGGRARASSWEDVPIPLILRTERFHHAWRDYAQHREQVKRPLTELAAKKALKKLANAGEGPAVKALDESVQNGWQGVFPENHIGKEPSEGTRLSTEQEASEILDEAQDEIEGLEWPEQ